MLSDFVGRDDWATAVAIQRDGKIVVAGGSSRNYSDNSSFELARYTRAGISTGTSARVAAS